MPIYEYQCNNCGHTFTSVQRMSDRKLPESSECPECKQLEVKQAILSVPQISDPSRLGQKRDGNFQEVLKGIHSKTPGSQIDSYL